MTIDQLKAAHAAGCRIQIWHLVPGATSSADGQWDDADPTTAPTFRCPAHLYRVHPDDAIRAIEGQGEAARVPRKFGIPADAWEAAQFSFGGPGTGEGESFMDCTAWVGYIEGDDGAKTYGLHLSCDECPEEGSITLAEFEPPAPQPAARGDACATCNDNGMIGGPSFYAPDEGGVPCPDCSATDDAPAVVDEAMVERACAAAAKQVDKPWPLTCEEGCPKCDKLREHMHAILSAALAAQPQPDKETK